MSELQNDEIIEFQQYSNTLLKTEDQYKKEFFEAVEEKAENNENGKKEVNYEDFKKALENKLADEYSKIEEYKQCFLGLNDNIKFAIADSALAEEKFDKKIGIIKNIITKLIEYTPFLSQGFSFIDDTGAKIVDLIAEKAETLRIAIHTGDESKNLRVKASNTRGLLVDFIFGKISATIKKSKKILNEDEIINLLIKTINEEIIDKFNESCKEEDKKIDHFLAPKDIEKKLENAYYEYINYIIFEKKEGKKINYESKYEFISSKKRRFNIIKRDNKKFMKLKYVKRNCIKNRIKKAKKIAQMTSKYKNSETANNKYRIWSLKEFIIKKLKKHKNKLKNLEEKVEKQQKEIENLKKKDNENKNITNKNNLKQIKTMNFIPVNKRNKGQTEQLKQEDEILKENENEKKYQKEKEEEKEEKRKLENKIKEMEKQLQEQNELIKIMMEKIGMNNQMEKLTEKNKELKKNDINIENATENFNIQQQKNLHSAKTYSNITSVSFQK